MAEQQTRDIKLSKHDQDVIFNKPSLKEFVRLIKNGTINAIWPSTQQEFDWWNSEGREQYATISGRSKDDLKLKNIKTALTVYYGDHEDQTAENLVLDVAKTQEKFNNLNTTVSNFKNSLVTQMFFDTVDELNYPALSLNQSTGAINNVENFNNNHAQVRAKFAENLSIIQDLKDKVSSFEPLNAVHQVYLKNSNLNSEYLQFFTNQEVNINSLLDLIDDINLDVDSLLESYQVIQSATGALQGYNVFNFNKLNNLIDFYNNQLLSINNLISEYYNIENFSTFQEKVDEIKDIASSFNSYQNHFSSKAKELCGIAKQQHPNLYNSIINLTSSDITIPTPETAADRTIEYIKNAVEERRDIYKSFLILQSKGNYSNIDAAEADAYIDAIIDYLEEDGRTYAQGMNYVASVNGLISPINRIISELKNSADITTLINQAYSYSNQGYYDLFYAYNPSGVINHSAIRLELNSILDIILAEIKIAKFYEKASGNVEERLESIFNDMIDILYTYILGQNLPDETPPLTVAQDNSLSLLEEILNLYSSLVTSFINTTFTAVDHEEGIDLNEEQGIITNENELRVSIDNQYTKALAYIDAIELLTDSNTVNTDLQKINKAYEDIKKDFESIEIVNESYSTEEDFNNWINTNINEDDLRKAVNHIARLTNITALIPIPSSNYMEISNKTDIETNCNNIMNTYDARLVTLNTSHLNAIQKILLEWTPAYTTTAIEHYICVNVGSFIQFPNISSKQPYYDGSIHIQVDGDDYYPELEGLADDLTDSKLRDTQVPTIAGLQSVFGDKFDKIGSTSVGGLYAPIYLDQGVFKHSSGAVSGNYHSGNDKKASINYWEIVHTDVGTTVGLQATKLFGAVYNDYAEYRMAEAEPGRCIIEKGDGTLSLSTGRLQLGANIVSDTYGFAIGETNDATCPVAVCGRVLVYPLESKEVYTPGAAVCSGPEGTISLMSREEIREWPDAIVGYVSEVPTYDTWGTDNVSVNGRIWIKIK